MVLPSFGGVCLVWGFFFFWEGGKVIKKKAKEGWRDAPLPLSGRSLCSAFTHYGSPRREHVKKEKRLLSFDYFYLTIPFVGLCIPLKRWPSCVHIIFWNIRNQILKPFFFLIHRFKKNKK